MRLVAALTATLALAAPAIAASAEDPTINAVYRELVRARSAGDVAGMTSAFAGESLLIDPRPGPVIKGSELRARLEPMAARLVKEGVTIDTAYRIERRSVIGDVALDAGFMRMNMKRPDGQANSRYARFLLTLKRQPDGVWKILGDASMPSTAEAFDAVARTDGLHYDP